MSIEPSELESAAQLIRTYGKLLDFNQEDLEEATGRPFIPSRRAAQRIGEDGFHADDLRQHLERAQSSIKTWLALQTDDGLEKRLDAELTEEFFQEWVKTNIEAGVNWTTLGRADFRKFMHDEFLGELQFTMNAALSGITVGITFNGFDHVRHHRPLTIYSASFTPALQSYGTGNNN